MRAVLKRDELNVRPYLHFEFRGAAYVELPVERVVERRIGLDRERPAQKAQFAFSGSFRSFYHDHREFPNRVTSWEGEARDLEDAGRVGQGVEEGVAERHLLEGRSEDRRRRVLERRPVVEPDGEDVVLDDA